MTNKEQVPQVLVDELEQVIRQKLHSKEQAEYWAGVYRGLQMAEEKKRETIEAAKKDPSYFEQLEFENRFEDFH